ncbi:LysM peptidoglycan-binding domain-containing protein [Rothia sp. P5764]|uniref:LysM peptidoglycan-binding domain-containing protein n=1 Tax=Rothia sp. P5764 TaxID=3402654 RepID=UPI003AD560FC
MSTIALPEFMARTSLKKPLDQAATFVPRSTASEAVSAGSVRQPRYRIRYAPLSPCAGHLEANASSSGRIKGAAQRQVAHADRPTLPATKRGLESLEAGQNGYQVTWATKHSSRVSQRGGFRLTRRGRLIFRGLPLLTLAALMVLGAFTFAFPTQAKSSTSYSEAPVSQMVRVYHGDSLWTIAQQVAPGQDSRDVVNRIMQINDLRSAQVEPGQVLEVPVYSK